jgi:hypothetical protein
MHLSLGEYSVIFSIPLVVRRIFSNTLRSSYSPEKSLEHLPLHLFSRSIYLGILSTSPTTFLGENSVMLSIETT